MGEIEDRARAFVEHVGIEAFGPKQGDVALEPHAFAFSPASSPASTASRPFELGARLRP